MDTRHVLRALALAQDGLQGLLDLRRIAKPGRIYIHILSRRVFSQTSVRSLRHPSFKVDRRDHLVFAASTLNVYLIPSFNSTKQCKVDPSHLGPAWWLEMLTP